MEIHGLSDKGLKRENNEDSFIFNKKGKYAIVADGMGGHLGGEVASDMCTRRLSELINGQAYCFTDYHMIAGCLESSVVKINSEIHQRSLEEEDLRGMGTTLSCMIEFKGRIIWLNVGDSRIYQVRKEEIRQLTQDDSLVEELYRKGEITKSEQRIHPLKNVITKAIGTEAGISLKAQEAEYNKNDYYILCSDGLCDMLEDEEILKIILENKKPKRICMKLIRQANENGGRDNITVVVLRF
jgi:serine/threonine protein phosphatase PrpC